MEELTRAFRAAAAVPQVRGFAVGRTIFVKPAQAWLAGKITDEAAVEMLAQTFGELVQAWQVARGGASA